MIKGSFAYNVFIKYLVIAYTTILVFLSHIYPEKIQIMSLVFLYQNRQLEAKTQSIFQLIIYILLNY